MCMILTSESGLIISIIYGDETHAQGNLLTSRFRRREQRLLAHAMGLVPLLIWSVRRHHIILFALPLKTLDNRITLMGTVRKEVCHLFWKSIE